MITFTYLVGASIYNTARKAARCTTILNSHYTQCGN